MLSNNDLFSDINVFLLKKEKFVLVYPKILVDVLFHIYIVIKIQFRIKTNSKA